ncbi:hypothetical protein TNCV_3650091 [Trichonephila clavipes]|nr:hypothetical protein TNCV_3650091 [Trichonephila clavipes]
MPPDWQRPDRGSQNSSWQRAERLSLAVALSTILVSVRFGSIPPQRRGRTLWGGQRPPTNIRNTKYNKYYMYTHLQNHGSERSRIP